MIVKMSRYDFVLFAEQSDDFLARLRHTGLVDITATGWEPTEQDRQLLTDIENYRKAVAHLETFGRSESMRKGAAPYADGAQAYAAYADAQQRKAALTADVTRLTKMADEIEPWVIEALKNAGCDTAKSVLELPVEEIATRADLEIEQAQKVVEILKAEFEE